MNGTFKVAVVTLMAALFALGNSDGDTDSTLQRVETEAPERLVEQPAGVNGTHRVEQVRS